MSMPENSLDNLCFDDVIAPDDDDDASERLYFDIDTLIDMIDDPPESPRNKSEDSLVNVVPQGLRKLEEPSSVGIERPGPDACSFSQNLEVSDNRAGSSEGSSSSAGKAAIFDGENQYGYAQNGTPMCSLPGSHADWNSQRSSNYSQDISYELQGLTHNLSTGNSDVTHGSYVDLVENSSQSLGAPNMEESAILNASLSSQSALYSQFGDYEYGDIEYPVTKSPDTMEFYDQDSIGSDSTSYFGPPVQCSTDGFGNQSFKNNAERMAMNNKYGMLQSHDSCLEDAGTEYMLPNFGISDDNTDFGQTIGMGYPAQNLSQMTYNTCSNKQGICIKEEENKVPHYTTMDSAASRNFLAIDDQIPSKKRALSIKNEEKDEWYVSDRKPFDVDAGSYADKCLRQPLISRLASTSTKSRVIVKDEVSEYFPSSKAHHSLGKNKICMIPSSLADGPHSVKPLCFNQSKQLVSTKEEVDSVWAQPQSYGSYNLKSSHQVVQSDSWAHKYHGNDEPDVCILEDLSDPASQYKLATSVKLNISSQSSSFVESHNDNNIGSVRIPSKGERFIYRAALQDISQPKTEANPPDGLLGVPLLKHQRIALSWMVQKETNFSSCSGGILADDQGLGKTISTIALILKERSPSSKVWPVNNQNMEMLNLVDDDDDGISALSRTNEGIASCQDKVSGLTVIRNPSVNLKVRPAAGTLIVCPTSVLRQWSEELHSKVTSKANLSVLTYHGANRTKDPFELAKYDIVLTTYAIVSMEVPKQPLIDKDDEEAGSKSHLPPMEHPSTKKRKYPPSSGRRSLKCKKGDSELIESVARPLAQVSWFRIVLDEAQSIKNYKTQVARACWGLRAKRRWCLSGTPIQNSIDDLYSYFRFLKYERFAEYKFFCANIKAPIQRNPVNGYRKLQAVLKTIMLRRTKGTILDGEPIINLPPKTIKLKKVEFTMDERDFYSTLETESRAQFAKYEAAGTVKQNYVNILLMLLRLRQACDHPLLVRGCGSSSAWFSSVEMAKKLPPEKQTSLLNCLEDSLAICGICNDPPEDAVVTSCGHVFCNQCICEHLSGDDNQCPTTNCKVRLSISSVFSKETLRTSLSEGLENVADCSGSLLAETLKPCSNSLPAETLQPCSEGGLFDSSKIKAAIEVLQSLSKPRSLMQKPNSSNNIDGGAHCSEDLSNTFSVGSCSNGLNNESTDLDRDSCNLKPAVGEKAIVFSQWTRMLDLLEACLKDSSINYRRLDGTMSVIARDKAVKDFNTQPEVTVIIMSLKAASLGLNMVAACHVILLDLWWNPTTEDQAIDRAHRIGQTRPVSVLRLTVKDTVEDRILALQQKKREMVASAFGEDETGSRQTRLTVEDLQYLFDV